MTAEKSLATVASGLEQEKNRSGSVNRRRVLGLTATGGAALAGAILAQGLRSEKAQAHSWLTVEVTADFDTYDAMREPAEGDASPTGPFYIEGLIYPNGTLDEEGVAPEDAQSIGTFRCWGWQYDGSAETGNASVNQSFELDNVGEIQIQGRDMNNKVVSGGTGAFRNASGELVFDMINMDLVAFRATFTD